MLYKHFISQQTYQPKDKKNPDYIT